MQSNREKSGGRKEKLLKEKQKYTVIKDFTNPYSNIIYHTEHLFSTTSVMGKCSYLFSFLPTRKGNITDRPVDYKFMIMGRPILL